MTPERGLIDTSVVIALGAIEVERLPFDMAISTLTLAELASGPTSATGDFERAQRLESIQHAEATFEPLSFDPHCARAYGRVYSAVMAIGRKARGPRATDLMIAATALAHQIPLYTLNAADLKGLNDLIEIVDLSLG